MAALEARDVWKTYDRVRYVLEGISFEVDPGEVLVLMGRSGSGKTTLLNLLAGLDDPSDGELLVAGRNLAEIPEEKRTAFRREHLGIVFQRFHLIPELTVAENVRLPMRLAGREDAQRRTDELLSFFGIEELADAFPATLSGGETQRAAIARGLGNEPSAILADEPTANLDEGNARNALAALEEVAQELETAVVIATHDPLAAEAGDRVLHLTDGKLDPEAGVTEPGLPASAGWRPPAPSE